MSSVSYPYLEVARDHHVPYSAVLALADVLDMQAKHFAPKPNPLLPIMYNNPQLPQWKRATLEAWEREHQRRSQ